MVSKKISRVFIRNILTILIISCLCSCATFTEWNRPLAKQSEYYENKTNMTGSTQAEVLNVFGKPSQERTLYILGSRQDIWTYDVLHSGKSIIIFIKDGVVTDVSYY